MFWWFELLDCGWDSRCFGSGAARRLLGVTYLSHFVNILFNRPNAHTQRHDLTLLMSSVVIDLIVCDEGMMITLVMKNFKGTACGNFIPSFRCLPDNVLQLLSSFAFFRGSSAAASCHC